MDDPIRERTAEEVQALTETPQERVQEPPVNDEWERFKRPPIPYN